MSRMRQYAICLYCQSVINLPKAGQFYCSDACRFWDKVEKRGPNDCWEWTAAKDRQGYGHFRYKGDLINAHRLVWLFTHGPIPKNLCALHHCDNEGCCNPSHLFLGTHRDNMLDMVKKGRHHNKFQQLTEQQVKEIKIELTEGTFHRSIAKKYGVVRETITAINRHKSWSHVIGPMQQSNLFS